MREFLQRYEGKTVAVTGAAGYLGSALTEGLAKVPVQRLLVSRRPAAPVPGAEVLTADVRHKSCWQEIVRRADVVFHAAGNASPHVAATEPADSLNSTLLPLAHLLSAAQEAKRTTRVVYASSARVYGFIETLPVPEDRDVTPVTAFGLHNLFAEQFLALASAQGLLEGISLRLANVYGPSPSGSTSDARSVPNKMARLAVQGADLPLYGDGDYLRDYVYIDDVVRAFLIAGAEPGMTGQSFNVGSGRGITLRDVFYLVAKRAEQATGRRSRVCEVPWPDDEAPIEARPFTADIQRISSACGWTPTVSFTDGIDRLIASVMRTNADS